MLCYDLTHCILRYFSHESINCGAILSRGSSHHTTHRRSNIKEYFCKSRFVYLVMTQESSYLTNYLLFCRVCKCNV